MKQAYLFLFSTLPAFGDSTNNCTSIEDDDICISTAGCGFNNGVYSCESCPDHSTSAPGSTDVNDCQCNSNFPNRILDENGKLIGCSACADNAIFYDGSCQCNYGYYGNGTSSCTQCPTGMTTNNLDAIDIASCVMKSNTKFCTVSQNRTLCLNFIPAGTQINYPGTSH